MRKVSLLEFIQIFQSVISKKFTILLPSLGNEASVFNYLNLHSSVVCRCCMLFVLPFRTTTNLKCFEKKDLPKFNSTIITAEEREIEAVFNNLLPVENFANVGSVSSDEILQSEVMQSSQFSLMEEKTQFPAVSAPMEDAITSNISQAQDTGKHYK